VTGRANRLVPDRHGSTRLALSLDKLQHKAARSAASSSAREEER
jgi:hypothetical protein